ncbi:hypothetical protein GDO78_004413 [Eleutherodactylus coqui]|uniref:Uncharacterized protein n=1 Tax=Eleutherodactylus coqui TaxID=57060 RepID=A0A8J6ESL1_ELECQ|nr:hypothetical protein GDO78_004413 [Eleutherodactylus coqui]
MKERLAGHVCACSKQLCLLQAQVPHVNIPGGLISDGVYVKKCTQGPSAYCKHRHDRWTSPPLTRFNTSYQTFSVPLRNSIRSIVGSSI